MTGDTERVDDWDEQRAPPAAAPPNLEHVNPAVETEAAPADGGDTRPDPTWRQMARATPAWVWGIGCGGVLSICAMFFVIMLLVFTAK